MFSIYTMQCLSVKVHKNSGTKHIWMIANPNKLSIFQWDSHEDKHTYCTETADNPKMNPVLLNGGICSATRRLFSDHCSSQAMEQKLHSGVCVAGQSELLLIAMLPTYIKKIQTSPPNFWLQMCPSSSPCSSKRDCSAPRFNSMLVSESEQEMLQELETRLKHLHSSTPINNNLQSPFPFSVIFNEFLFQD